MKKLLLSAISALFIFTFSTGIANAATTSTVTPAIPAANVIQVLTDFNTWLTVDNNSGINFVNDTMSKALEKAKTWDSGARLQEFSITFEQNKTFTCSFTFSSVLNEKQIVTAPCPVETKNNITTMNAPSNVTTAIKENTALITGIYTVSLRLRDLIKPLSANKTLLELAQAGTLGGTQENLVTTFRLLKNTRGITIWEVTVTNPKTAKSIIVKTSAETGTPNFSVFTSR